MPRISKAFGTSQTSRLRKPAASRLAEPITFVVAGQRTDSNRTRADGSRDAAVAAPPMGLRGTVSASVRLVAGRSAGGADAGVAEDIDADAMHRLVAVPGRDVVVLHLANGPSLVLHPHTARDLMRAQAGTPTGRRRGAAAPKTAAPHEVTVPAQWRWSGLESHAVAHRGAARGFLGDVLLAAIEVVRSTTADAALNDAANAAADQIAARVDSQVVEGVYALQADTLTRLKGQPVLATMPAPVGGGPILVLLHGTFSDTSGSFGQLWQQHPQRVRMLFAHYKNSVFALDHATLANSPIDNAYTLARACPDGARLHLLTHSRGGLVAEVLARAAGLTQLDDAAAELFVLSALPTRVTAGSTAAERRALQRAVDGQKRVLGLLIAHLHQHRITVERVVRAACPARGTLLASQRFDAYLSVFKWALDLAHIAVLPELLDFIGAVALRRADPNHWPGVAAMVPNSPLVRWLHAAVQPVPGELRVIAGDMEGDTVGSWLKTLMADAFFWTDNDLVVQTRSMYGGAPRAGGARFLLDQGGRVTHFNYFANERTAAAVVSGLTQDAPALWREIGPLSYAGADAGGARGRKAIDSVQAAQIDIQRPAVLVLPGILGSHLQVDGERIWLGWRLINGLKLLAYPDRAGRPVAPDGVIGDSYDQLIEFLAATHQVIEFAFDWRKPMELEAQRLGRAVQAALTARAQTGQPVRMLAHSMGGLVARTMQLECPDVWAQMMARPGARLLMLGTPNAGSWAPMQVLSGDDSLGNLLVAVGAPFQDHAARQLMAQLPGFMQLQSGLVGEQPGGTDPRRLDLHATWARLAQDDIDALQATNWWHTDGQQLSVYEWGVPTQPVLDAAQALRRRLDTQRDTVLGAFNEQIVLVVGQALRTPDGYEIGDAGLVYLNGAQAGDGRVTHASAMLPGVRTWQVDSAHGDLANHRDAFAAYLDLLSTGTTQRLAVHAAPADVRGATAAASRSKPGTQPSAKQTTDADRAAIAPMRSRPSRERARTGTGTSAETGAATGAWPLQRMADVLRGAPSSGAPFGSPPSSALPVTVHNGDLQCVRGALMLGHYASSTLAGTEQVVNRWLGGELSDALALGQYPQAVGTCQLFSARPADQHDGAPQVQAQAQALRPTTVVVIGLGEEGALSGVELARSVKHGVLALAQQLAHQRTQQLTRGEGQPAGAALLQFELTSTLLGSGGTGISVGQAAQSIAQGVCDADQALRGLNGASRTSTALAGRVRWPRVGQLHFIELYLDRASEAWHALQLQAESAAACRTRLTRTVQAQPGALRRPLDGGYRGARYDFIRAVSSIEAANAADPTRSGSGSGSGSGSDFSGFGTAIEFTLDTQRARTEVRAQSTQAQLVRELVAQASNDQNHDTQIGRTLFQLLVPPEMEPYLGSSHELLIELDRGTAGIPWELLEPPRPGAADVDADADGGSDSDSDSDRSHTALPWAIRTKLLRKLRMTAYRQQVTDAHAESHVLVIGEPQCPQPMYPRLPGARGEAQAVRDLFASPAALGAERVRSLISANNADDADDAAGQGPDAREVVSALLQRDWRIVHVAGHGAPPERLGAPPQQAGDAPQRDGDPRGVVLSNGTYLGPREFASMRVVPELVFVNCCHLAARNPAQLFAADRWLQYDRAGFASNVADALMHIGVRCVVAAGWAVDDAAAQAFATAFYAALLRGARFIDAAAEARAVALNYGGITWAAYQCYGDPDWVFRRGNADAQSPAAWPAIDVGNDFANEFASVISPVALTLALETLAIRSQFQGAAAAAQRDKVRFLEARFAPLWGDMGAVAEAFAVAWHAAGDRGNALRWYQRAVAAADGSATMRAVAQLNQLRAETR